MAKHDINGVFSQLAMNQQLTMVEIFTDGACQGNPGPGGWGVILRYQNHEKELSGAQANTTNNRMELMAAIQGLRALSRRVPVTLTTDSKYVKQGITEWIKRWKQNGWRTANRLPVKNADLWQELDALVQQHDVQWMWIRGHSGHLENERADTLARNAIQQLEE